MPYTLKELADLAKVSARTIRYYIAEGLLPGSVGQGRTASYNDTHVQVLHDIAALKADGKGLAEIKRILEDRFHDFWKRVVKPDGNWDQFKLADDVSVSLRTDMPAQRRHTVSNALTEFARVVDDVNEPEESTMED